MKKTLISLATASLIASTAMAADKGVDLDVTGQAVIYYETHTSNATGDAGIADRANSNANVGVQLNVGGDLGNGFTLGSQLTFIDALGLNNNLVGDTNVKQVGGSVPNTKALGSTGTTDDLALTKIFIAKKIANTTLKIGRQELPKSLSPLAFSEGWNVFKNTFDAVVAINSDIPDTTLVGAYVAAANRTTGLVGLGQMQDLTAAGLSVTNGAYMLTVANKSIPMTALTASFYSLHGIDASPLGGGSNGNSATAMWIDAKIADKSLPLGLTVGLQGGQISPDLADMPTANDTTAMGLKVGMKPMDAVSVSLAYTTVDDGTVSVQNTGTGVKTPLFTQMVYNQAQISLDASTIVAKGAYSLGDAGTVIAQYGMTTDDADMGANDYSEFDLMYKLKAGGVQYFAAYIKRTWETTLSSGYGSDNKVRVWARYSF